MTGRARCFPALGNELTTVGFRVASFACRGGPFELNLLFSWQRFVTIATSNCPVRPDERKLRLRVVEPVYIGPGFRAVTRLAAKWNPIGAFALHAVVELAVMWIGVASRASLVREVERQNLVCSMRRAHLMAFAARYGHMRPRKRKFRVSMFGDGEERAVEVRHGMAILAAILVRSPCKLSVVSVLVAITAIRELNLVDRLLAGGKMAFRAFHFCMFSL